MATTVENVAGAALGCALLLDGHSGLLCQLSLALLVSLDLFVLLSPLPQVWEEVCLDTKDRLELLALGVHLLGVENLIGQAIHIAMVGQCQSIGTVFISIVHMLGRIAKGIEGRPCYRMCVKPYERNV